jgi:ADP-glucose pyrophosphorylase
VPAPPAVAPDAEVFVGADLQRAVVMRGARVAGTVRRSAILPGATVEARAEVIDSIIGPGAHIGAGARVVGGSVIGAGVEVAAGAVIDGQRIPEGDAT